MKILCDIYKESKRYYIKHKLSNGQTLFLSFAEAYRSTNTIHWNIVLNIHSKRKHASQNEENKMITGKNPFEDVFTAIKAFKLLEQYILEEFSKYNNIILCGWVDNRRRDAYYKVLHKMGYDYGYMHHIKLLIKKVPKKGETANG